MWGFGRTIALRNFIAVQQFRADFGTELVTAAMIAAGCSMQFVLPNRIPLPATREAGLVQIAKSRFQDSLVLETRVGLFASTDIKHSGRPRLNGMACKDGSILRGTWEDLR